jgi:2-polyprenyl-3-methyl-5-hydroxy-6-metoxy-1,4-benzoquinol methylase
MADGDLLHDQLAYYRARAREYDQWWSRQGRFDRGDELNALWFADLALLRTALGAFHPSGHILELACGTGLWTEQLVPYATTLTAVDGAAEMLAITAAKLSDARITFLEADLFTWQPPQKYDTIVFGFWLSHVPASHFASFWGMVASALAPGGRVFFCDSRHEPTSTAKDHQLPPPESTIVRRRLNDGSEHQVVKVFYDPSTLAAQLDALGWDFEISTTPHYFISGSGRRRP